MQKYKIYSIELVKENNQTKVLGTFNKVNQAKDLFYLCESLLATKEFSNQVKGVILVGWNGTKSVVIQESTSIKGE